MKRIKKILTAVLLPLVLTTSSIPSDASLGQIYYTESEMLRPGLDIHIIYSDTELSEESSDGELRSYVLSYIPGSGYVLPTITWGEFIYGRTTLEDMTGDDVLNGKIAAVNADFFSMKTGVPLGVITRGNTLYSNSETENALIITLDDAYISQPGISLEITNGEVVSKIDYYNKYPTKYGAYLLSKDWGESTRSSSSSCEIVLRSENSELLLNSNTACIVEEVRKGVKNSEIPDGCFVLTYEMNGTAANDPLFSVLEAGDELTITVMATEDISCSDAVLAVGGGDMILKNGFFDESLVDESHEKQKNPRTAVGITEDGRVIFYACDGRSKNISEGLTLSELAAAMSELGCVDAMNLDGGGSTTVMIDGVTVNNPSDGKQRAISDAVVFLDNPMAAEYLTKSLKILPEYHAVLAGGGETQLETRLMLEDRSMGDILPDDGIVYEISPADMGYIENGRFIAGEKSGSAKITAKCNIGEGQIFGNTTIYVYPSLTSLTVKTDKAELAAFGTVKLSAYGKYRNVDVGVSASQLRGEESNSAELAEGISAIFDFGTLYSDGTLAGNGDVTATERKVSVELSCGGSSAKIELSYGINDTLLDDFEDISGLTGSISQTDNLRVGRKALVVDDKAEYYEPIVLNEGACELTSWMLCRADAFVRIADSIGRIYDIKWEEDIVLNRKGWSYMRAVIPSEAVHPVSVTAPVICNSGTVTVDALTVGYGVKKSSFVDVDEEHWAAHFIDTVNMMGMISGNIADDKIYYRPDDALTRAEFAKLLTSYFGFHAAHAGQQNFVDADFPEWALPYASIAVTQGLMNGKAVTDQGILFDPNAHITRVEVMQVFGSLLDCEEADLSSFSDNGDIPDWARHNAAKTAASGIVGGYPDGTVRPNEYISRAEIAVMFVRFDAAVF